MTDDDLIQRLLADHGQTFAAEIGIDLGSGEADALFQWLVAAILFSARISTDIAVKAARAVIDAGWTSAHHMADSAWEDRVTVLNRSGYARYDESTARMLGDTVAHLLDQYDGDLYRLRADCDREPGAMRRRLKACKGLGDVGVDIFFRETQTVWPELYPFADRKSLAVAGELGLGDNARDLADRVDRQDLPRLVAALVRADRAKAVPDLKAAAGG